MQSVARIVQFAVQPQVAQQQARRLESLQREADVLTDQARRLVEKQVTAQESLQHVYDEQISIIGQELTGINKALAQQENAHVDEAARLLAYEQYAGMGAGRILEAARDGDQSTPAQTVGQMAARDPRSESDWHHSSAAAIGMAARSQGRLLIKRTALRDYCLGLKGTTEEFPFGPEAAVMKVMNKMFALIPVDGQTQISLKCDPEWAIVLRDTYEAITAGYHLSKSSTMLDSSI